MVGALECSVVLRGRQGDEIGDEDRDAAGDAVGATSSSLIYRNAQSILQVMQSPSPPLLPLLRSALQGEILALILLNPEQEWSLTDLASRVGTAVSTAQREVSRAEDAGVVVSRRVGNTRLVRALPSPITEPLTELLLRSFGPPQVVAEEFDSVGGIEGIYVFGSWAARYAGAPGRAPADLDVLVIGRPDRDKVEDAAERARYRLGRDVNVTIRSLEWWRHGTDGFHAEVTTRPLVTIQAAPEGGDAP